MVVRLLLGRRGWLLEVMTDVGDDGGNVLAFLLVVFDVFVLLMGTTAASGMIGNGAAGTLGSGAGVDVGVGVEEACGVVALLGIALLLFSAGNAILD